MTSTIDVYSTQKPSAVPRNSRIPPKATICSGERGTQLIRLSAPSPIYLCSIPSRSVLICFCISTHKINSSKCPSSPSSPSSPSLSPSKEHTSSHPSSNSCWKDFSPSSDRRAIANSAATKASCMYAKLKSFVILAIAQHNSSGNSMSLLSASFPCQNLQ